ncbi:MAG: radical SAM protein, partial [Chloroflexi bacterium]|nr:radical SAM protein [Chloroflexota bacterium]
APYRLDCALTYRLPDGEDPNAAPNDRVKSELSTQDWITILDKAWAVGIPQIIFTGGEPTLRDDLVELITHTQQIGQVSGLLTDGSRLSDPSYLQSLLQSGLDHVMLVLNPEKEDSWEALKALLASDIFTTAHLTITPESAGQMDAYLARLVEMGAKNLSLSASDVSLTPRLAEVRKHAAEHLLSLMWDLPVPYSDIHPVAFEKNETAPDGAGTAWLYVEPDGDVLPAQGINRVLGNILNDPWEKIWKQPRGRGVIQ